MNRLRLPIVAATLVGATILAACGGGSATSKPTTPAAVPSASAPSATSPSASSTAIPAASIPAGGASVEPTAPAASSGVEPSEASGPSFAVPSFAVPSFAVPSFTTDNDLAAKFPTTVDGQPVTNVETYLFADLLGFGGQSQEKIQQLAQSLAGFGIDLSKLSGGSASATIGGEEVQLQALRAPGGDASQIVNHYNEIAAVFSQILGGAVPSTAPTLSQADLGGKHVTVATDSEGDKTYLYPTGDTLWIVENMTDEQAATLLGALQ